MSELPVVAALAVEDEEDEDGEDEEDELEPPLDVPEAGLAPELFPDPPEEVDEPETVDQVEGRKGSTCCEISLVILASKARPSVLSSTTSLAIWACLS